MKIAFVVQRYGLEVNGGAETLCRWLAEHMSKYWDIEIVTTCAIDYITWENEYSEGKDTVNDITVWRFPVDKPRWPFKFNYFSRKVFYKDHNLKDELRWMKAQGPYSTKLLKFIEDKREYYDFFIFFTYLYCTTYFGMPFVKEKAFLVPTVEDAPPLRLNIFQNIFNMPRGIIYNTIEEKVLVNTKFNNSHIPSEIIGVGVNEPEEINPEKFKQKYNFKDRFIIYVGRIDGFSKGCSELFSFFIEYKEQNKNGLKLVLLGKKISEIPKHPDIYHLGFLSEEDKFNAIAASELLVMPSIYESLSIVLLEAWMTQTPVLVNGKCDVLREQCKRSNGGLYYNSFEEFKDSMDLLLENEVLRNKLAESGKKYTYENYNWNIIERKYLNFINKCSQS